VSILVEERGYSIDIKTSNNSQYAGEVGAIIRDKKDNRQYRMVG